jgi:hypothetical protein
LSIQHPFRQTAGTASKNAANLYKFAPDFHNKCQKMQLDLCIVYTQEANSGNAELGVKISCASSLLTANRLRDSI